MRRKKLLSSLLCLLVLMGSLSYPLPALAIDAPTGVTATPLSCTSIQISWNHVESATGYKINQTIVPANTVDGLVYSYTVTGLTPNTSYSYGVSAVAADQESVQATASAVTNADNDNPTDPSALVYTGQTSTSISLSWNASTDASTTVRYMVYYKQGIDPTVPFTLRATVTSPSYSATGLSVNKTYSFYVSAVDVAGNLSGASNTITPTTLPDQQPTVPTVAAPTAGESQVNLTWSGATDDVGIVSYEVYKSSDNGSTYTRLATPTGTSYSDTAVTSNTTYYYKVRAKDTAGNFSGFSEVRSGAPTPDTTNPTPPSTVTARAISTSNVIVSWSGATDNKAVVSYEVYRAKGTGSFSRLGSTDSSSYSDSSSLESGATYNYYVRAKDAAGNFSANSSTVSVLLNGDTAAPSKPANLSLSLNSSTSVNLNWSSSTDNTGVTGYRIYMAEESGSFSLSATASTNSYTRTGLTSGRTYRFYVVAYDAAGNESTASDTQTIYTSTSSRTDTETVSSSQTGTLEISSLAKLDIPRNARPNATVYTMADRNFSSYSTSNYKTFGQPVDFTAAENGTSVTTFNEQLTITFYYTSSQLGDTSTSKLGIYWWDSGNSAWVYVPSTVNSSSRTVTAQINHFTVFALLADTTAPSAPVLTSSTTSIQKSYTAKGTAEKNSIVEISVNNLVVETTATSTGNFSKEITLQEGDNTIKLRARDSAGNTGSWSSSYTVTVADEVKLIDITGHWAEKNIKRVVDQEIASGYQDKTFRPDKTITRAEFCKFVVAALGYNPVENASLNFKDASKIQYWARGFVAKAVENGIISGYADNTFQPERQITREEMASILVRAMKLQTLAAQSKNTKLKFADAYQIQSWARGSVVVAVDRGLISGYQNNTFGPGKKATRAEAVTMIVKMMDSR